MTGLLAQVIEAHGGLDRWKRYSSVSVDVDSCGELIETKVGKGDGRRHHILQAHYQQVTVTTASSPDKRLVMRPDRVAIETHDGRPIAEQYDVRPTFAGHTLETPWNAFQRGHFGGYAMWSYMTMPFSFAMPDVQVWDIDPLEHEGEVWQGLRVVMPSRIATHCRAQEFYFGPDFLVRRQDYTLDVAGGDRIANFALGIIDVDGFKFATKRRAYLCKKDYTILPDRLMVSLDFHNLTLG